MYISQLGLEDYTELNRFTNVQILSSPDSKGQHITFNNFDEYLLVRPNWEFSSKFQKVKDLGHTGNLRSLRLPTAKDGGNWDCSRLIHDIDYRRFNVVKIYEGEKELWHCETSLTTLFLMELTSSQVAIIEVEELAIRVEIVTNDLKEIARIIVSFLFNWDIDASALSLLNKIQSKTWLEYPETIKSFVTETIWLYVVKKISNIFHVQKVTYRFVEVVFLDLASDALFSIIFLCSSAKNFMWQVNEINLPIES